MGQIKKQHEHTHITMCKTDSQWEFAGQHRELNPGVPDDLEGGMGWEVEGRFNREGTYS